jgi:hypothetical protein
LRGGDLAVPTDLENNQNIYRVVKKRSIPLVWVGVRKTHEGFRTVFGEKVNFTNWNRNEPSGGREHCVELMYRPFWRRQVDFAGRWNDAICSASHRYYVCQV